MTRIYLDPTDSAPLRPGYEVAGSDAEFWRVALGKTPLHIKGERLCRWAGAFYEGRCQEVASYSPPTSTLRRLCPQLSAAQAKELMAELGAGLGEQPLELSWLASCLFEQPFFRELPGTRHAAQYLIWRSETQLTEVQEVVLHALLSDYGTRSQGPVVQAYAALTAADAEAVLKRWLGWQGRADESWEPFPEPLPQPLKRRLQQALRREITSNPLRFLELWNRRADELLLALAASVTADVMTLHPERLTPELLTTLGRYLDVRTHDALRTLLPVPKPSDVPQQVEELFTWFEREYLPYRLWVRQDAGFVQEIAREFAQTYLTLYAEALSGSADGAHLSWNRVGALSGHPVITLLVILDGFGFADLPAFQEALNRFDAQGEFVLAERQLAFGTLPSITRCSKPALERGVSPYRAANATLIGPKLTKDEALRSTLQAAQLGDMVLWSLQEPDRSYHAYKEPQTAREMAHSALGGIAKRLLDGIKGFAAPLRIVVTTDHGRLLGRSQRAQRIPEGMNAEGRAATGNCSKVFPEAGYLIEGDLVYLEASRFRMDEDAAIILTDDSFLMRDGKQGTDAFPHGGIYPEEVLVPWLLFLMDQNPIPITASLAGSGKAHSEAELTLSVVNPNSVALTLKALTLNFGGAEVEVPLDAAIKPMSSEPGVIVSIILPGEQAAERASARLTYQRPDGTLEQITASVRITSHEMYRQSNPLEDLL